MTRRTEADRRRSRAFSSLNGRLDDRVGLSARHRRKRGTAAEASRRPWARYARPGVCVLVAAVSLYMVLPSLLAVFASWRSLRDLAWYWAALALLSAIGSFVLLWELDRLALPVRALPAIVAGAPVDRGLTTSAYLGAAVLLLLVVAGVLAFAFDRPVEDAGRAAQWVLNGTLRRRRKLADLPRRLLAQRDFIRTTIGRRWRAAVLSAAGSTAFDLLALLCALRAVGAEPRPSLVVLAYAAASLLTLIPLTPGGLGFVEAGLVGTLALAGVSPGDALLATLTYRLVSFWLPIPAGAVAYGAFRRRYP